MVLLNVSKQKQYINILAGTILYTLPTVNPALNIRQSGYKTHAVEIIHGNINILQDNVFPSERKEIIRIGMQQLGCICEGSRKKKNLMPVI